MRPLASRLAPTRRRSIGTRTCLLACSLINLRMTRGKLIVAAFHGHEAEAESLQRDLQCAWPLTPQPAFTVGTIEHLGQPEVESADVVVVPAPESADRRRLLAFMSVLDQAGIPAVVIGSGPTVKPFHHAGALVLPWETELATIAAALHGVIYRQSEFKQLHQDLLLAHRFHGGLEGEIARMHEELQLAAMVQRELLPRETPTVHNVSFATMWRPVNYVSGDIFDVTRLDEDHVGVFITDAVGHGVPAALMTMVISRSLCLKEIDGHSYRLLSPSEVLARLNAEMIRRQGRTTRFATAVYALVNCRDRTCTLAGAGHPPPLLVRPGAPTESIETSGGLLGIFEDESFPQVQFDLHVDDTLIFYSDGFEQAFPSPGADLYECRLPTTQYRDEFQRLAYMCDPAEMINQLRQRIDAQRGSLNQADDLTLICMRVGAFVQSPLPTSRRDQPAAASHSNQR